MATGSSSSWKTDTIFSGGPQPEREDVADGDRGWHVSRPEIAAVQRVDLDSESGHRLHGDCIPGPH